jgi:hypothetical protein
MQWVHHGLLLLLFILVWHHENCASIDWRLINVAGCANGISVKLYIHAQRTVAGSINAACQCCGCSKISMHCSQVILQGTSGCKCVDMLAQQDQSPSFYISHLSPCFYIIIKHFAVGLTDETNALQLLYLPLVQQTPAACPFNPSPVVEDPEVGSDSLQTIGR